MSKEFDPHQAAMDMLNEIHTRMGVPLVYQLKLERLSVDKIAERHLQAAYALANLQASKPEQAQMAVGLPEPDGYVAMFPTGSKIVPPQEARAHVRSYPFYTADQMESYATAKTAEAVGELVGVLKHCLKHDEFFDIGLVERTIAKYAPSQEGKNGG